MKVHKVQKRGARTHHQSIDSQNTKKNTLQGASVPAASDPHSPLLLPTSNLLDLDTLLPHIGQCLGGDDDCDFDGADDVDGDEEGKK